MDWKQILGLAARRATTVAATFLVAHGALASGDTANFVQIGSGILVGGAEALLEWWRTSGKVLVDAQLARVKGVHPDQLNG